MADQSNRSDRRPPSDKPRTSRFGAWLLPVAVILTLLIFQFTGNRDAARVPYSTFVQYLESGRVQRVTVGASYVRATLKAPDSLKRTEIIAVRVDPTLVTELRERGVEFAGETSDGWMNLLFTWVLPLLLFIGV